MSENSENNIEIYKQRYETYRYLDKLFWQMFQIAIGSIAVVAAILKIGDTSFTIPIALISFLWVFIGGAMLRQRDGIRTNHVALKKAADSIGDNDIPRPKRNGISDVIAKLIVALGFIGFSISIILHWCIQ